ncbi:hypothetical protein IV203_002331 [Nitzschia inconspicua]|uniref:Uncharacterized protein n=1 Tax=Nitzschia inconspicua TaxID=303405 RepID=A0A9K3PSF9_9STRA|nr:hypothetical protein IV203_002331 [Nitzschia inconspicua]
MMGGRIAIVVARASNAGKSLDFVTCVVAIDFEKSILLLLLIVAVVGNGNDMVRCWTLRNRYWKGEGKFGLVHRTVEYQSIGLWEPQAFQNVGQYWYSYVSAKQITGIIQSIGLWKPQTFQNVAQY